MAKLFVEDGDPVKEGEPLLEDLGQVQFGMLIVADFVDRHAEDGGERLDRPGLLLVDVVDERLPRPFRSSRVEIDLDEPVDGIDRRGLVAHPGDVVGGAVGVLAALYLREYATRGPVTAAVRIAINNLAGVPSIVYGAFGLGFFCYGVGAGIDELFFRPALVADGQPTFGTGGILWAALTLALLTLPVVIVATEEALSAVPNSMREGSYACGAGKWQTIRRIVLPRALPGIMTGLILAMARGAGEVAPLMLVGVKKLALELPVDGTFPFIHPEREFMHLAYLIYDVGFQSPNSQAARPMVFTITFLLVAIIALLNVAAIWIRSRLRRRFVAQQF